MNIVQQVIAQILRFRLTLILTGFFAANGVDVEMQNQFIESAIEYAVPALTAGALFGVEYLRVRYGNKLLQAAVDANPRTESVESVKAKTPII